MLPASTVSGDKTRFCPYDITHVILAKSFDAHLIKCRENHRGCKMVVCPLDHTHVVPKPELNHHLSQCDKRSLMDRELQKRAGIDVLKGDVEGPPIVADHLAGKDDGDTENWDDAPVRSFPTPALFNEKIKKAPKDSYGIIPGGGYAPPSAIGEPQIRKIPNNPAKAALLATPTPGQIRPTRNQVFEYSIGNTRMSRPDGNLTRPASAPLQAVAPGAPGGMTRVPAPDQGPRFIGRGISKYATKSAPRPAGASSPGTPPSPNAKSHSRNYSPGPGKADQFEDVTSRDNNSPVKASTSQTNQSLNRDGRDGVTQPSQQGNFNNGAFASGLNAQQMSLQQGILLHQQQQLEQLKQQHNHQQMELAKKHHLQNLQLQKLQEEEKKKLVQEHERREMELCAKAQALIGSIQEMSSLTSSQIDPGIQNALETSMGAGGTGGNPVSGILPSLSAMAIQGSSNPVIPSEQSGVRTEAVSETWHESRSGNVDIEESPSRLAVHNSREDRDIGSSTSDRSSPADLHKTKTTLENTLREIDILEQKSMLGHVLSRVEENKLKTKGEVEEKLAALLSS